MNRIVRTFSLALVAASIAACSSKTKSEATATAVSEGSSAPSKTKPSSSSASSAAAAPALTEKPSKPFDPNAPGPAILSFSEGGTYILDGGKLTKIGEYSVDGVLVGKDGKAYLSGIQALVLQDGKATKFDAPGAQLALGGDGTLWTLSGYEHQIAKRGADGEWTKEAVPDSTSHTLTNIAVDQKGDVYVSSLDNFYVKKGGTWSTHDFKEIFKSEDKVFVTGLSVFNGDVYFVTSSGVSTMDGKTLKLPMDYGMLSLSSDAGTTSSTGTLALYGSDATYVISPDGKVSTKKLEALPVKGTIIESFTVDAQGRRWIGAGGQLYILDKDDKLLQTWPVGSIPGAVRFVQVIGAGPELPPAPDPVVKAPVKGRLVVDGAPVKNTELVACGSPHMFITGATPCSGQPVELTAKTDDNGAFHFDSVPRGSYGFAWREGGSWKITLGYSGSCCSKIVDGQEFDMSDLQVKSN